jgi:hypothetical protein
MLQHLPGVQIRTNDGGLAVNSTPTTRSLLIIGTAARGVSDTPFLATDPDRAVAQFGTQGTLTRAMQEASTYCDHIYLMRVGTTPAQLAGVGADDGNTDGITIELGERAGDIYGTSATRVGYQVWYMDGVLYVWLDGTLVYSNDSEAGNVRDSGNVVVSGIATAGLAIAKSIAGSGTIATTGASVVGTLTEFVEELAIGDFIQAPSGETRKVSVVTDLTHVTLSSAFSEDVVAASAFKIIKANTAKTPDGALSLTAAAALATIGDKTKPVLTTAVLGLDLTLRELYIAQEKALKLAETFPVNGVFAPGTFLDAPNVAFYLGNPATAVHNPVTNADALDWLKSATDEYGVATYHWASETTDSTGATVSAATFLNRQDREDQGYHEVNFAYQLVRFAQKQEEEQAGGCWAFIGASGPKGYDQPNIRKWIGYLPKYDEVTGLVTVSGSGLLGIPALVGCAAGSLNTLASDALIGRTPGFFKTDSGEMDGASESDANGYPVDLGAYLHVVGDHAYIGAGAGAYVGNISGIVAGMVMAIDPKSSPTNKPLRGVRQLYRTPSLTQLDALTYANVNMLKFKRLGDPPYLLHGMTAANDQSDWTNVLRMNIKFLVVKSVYEEGDKFVGESTADGMQLQAMQTALDSRLQSLQKKGYLQRYRFNVRTTQADQRIGRAYIDVLFMPADELVQLRATVGISRQ